MAPVDPLQIARTLRPLRWRQAWAQLTHALHGIHPPRAWVGAAPALRTRSAPVHFLANPDHARLVAPREIELLSRRVTFADSIDWNHAGEGPLFAYHLNQFDYVRGPQIDAAQRTELILDWISNCRDGAGWDPHPISLRTFNWCKLLCTPDALALDGGGDERVRMSLASQFDALDRNIEVRLQANHLLSNLMSVVLGGLMLEHARADAWLDRTAWLCAEIDAQVLPDGAHEERSPMYHSLLLENLMDLLAFARAVEGRAPAALVTTLEAACRRMLTALALWTHPDGEIALFADSAHGIAQAPAALAQLAAQLDLTADPDAGRGVLAQAGFVRLEAQNACLIASVAGPAPEHQPGHAHCDALAIELSLGVDRIICDTGVFEYVPGERREISRRTRSHATIEIAGREQAEIWAAHRVGARSRVAIESIEPGRMCEASCRGWATPRIVHTRKFEVADDGFVIRDVVRADDGRSRPELLAVWPLAPDIEVALVPPALNTDAAASTGARAELRTPNGGRIVVHLPSDFEWRLDEAPFYPRFGVNRTRPSLVGVGTGPLSAEKRFEIV